MDEKKSVFSYLSQIFTIFGVTVLILAVLAILCGEEAKEVSTIFLLGKRGITVTTLLQFFLASALTATVNMLFFSDGLIRRIPLWGRTVGMLLAEVSMIVVCVAVFGWFPMDMWQPWAMFFLTFFMCFGFSVAFTILKERIENRKMETALERIKQKEGEDGNGN